MPFPARNFGGHAEGFRVVELTGMKFTSLLKAELFMLPIIFSVSIILDLSLAYGPHTLGELSLCSVDVAA